MVVHTLSTNYSDGLSHWGVRANETGYDLVSSQDLLG